MTVAASVRRAVEAMLAGEGMVASDAPAAASAIADGLLVKLTLRLPATHVQLLTLRARRADASQGAYVAGLIEGTPLAPRPPDLFWAAGKVELNRKTVNWRPLLPNS